MQKYGLLGEKLSHSFSPQIHKLLGDYKYSLYEKKRDKLERFLLDNELTGFNITIPYKEDMLDFCQELSAQAKRIGSVNTMVKRADGSYYGDNTDYYGFAYLVKQSKDDLRGKKALILGSGGSSKTVRAVLEDMGADPVITVSRRGQDNYQNINKHSDAYMIINATPVGMFPELDCSPIDLSIFPDCKLVIDLIYNPARTKLLLQAQELGMKAINGLAMLVAQAKAASELFQDVQIADNKIDKITRVIAQQTKNIVMIGMPGSGKTTIGKSLSVLTGRAFYDIDKLIEKEAEMTIPEIFAQYGEKVFRQMETEHLTKVAKLSNAVIATGGGIVTVPENRAILNQNSVIVFIDRPLEQLPTIGRPLSQSRSLEDIYNERIDAYRSWSDYTFPSLGINETAINIREELQL